MKKLLFLLTICITLTACDQNKRVAGTYELDITSLCISGGSTTVSQLDESDKKALIELFSEFFDEFGQYISLQMILYESGEGVIKPIYKGEEKLSMADALMFDFIKYPLSYVVDNGYVYINFSSMNARMRPAFKISKGDLIDELTGIKFVKIKK